MYNVTENESLFCVRIWIAYLSHIYIYATMKDNWVILCAHKGRKKQQRLIDRHIEYLIMNCLCGILFLIRMWSIFCIISHGRHIKRASCSLDTIGERYWVIVVLWSLILYSLQQMLLHFFEMVKMDFYFIFLKAKNIKIHMYFLKCILCWVNYNLKKELFFATMLTANISELT